MLENERVLGVIGGSVKLGFLKTKRCVVMVTDRRLVYVIISNAMMSEAAKKAKEQARTQGRGFFGQWGSMIVSGYHFVDAYAERDPDEVLAESLENFAVPVESIQNARVDHETLRDHEGYEQGSKRIFRLKATGRKLALTIAAGPKDIDGMLRSAIGPGFVKGKGY